MALAAAGAVVGLTGTANAVDKFWVGPGSPTPAAAAYEDPNNWSPSGVPAAGDVVRVDNGGISVLSTNQSTAHLFPASTLSSSGTVQQTGGTLTLSGHLIIAEGGSSTGVYEMSGGAANVAGAYWVGSHGNGTLDLTNGAITANSGNGFQVGVQTNGVGTVHMSGGSISTSTIFVIGHHHSANGTLNLQGGTVTAGNASAPVSTALIIGGNNTTQGTLNQTGGTFNVLGQVVMSNSGDATSLFDISGGTFNAVNDNATATNDVSVRVGQNGTGTMKVRGTGVANVGRHVIVGGNNATTGIGTLEVADSAVLNVGMGANVTDGVLGIGANGVGTSTQSGGTINTDSVLHGYVANGVSRGESTQTGGALNVSGNMHVGRASSQNNFYNISGGTIDVGGTLTVAQLSNRTSASPTDPWAGTVSKGTLTIGNTAAVTVAGELSNSAGFTPTSGVNAGVAQPGGVGLIEMNGGTLTAGSFLNGATANTDPNHAGSGASANYVQSGGTASVGAVTGTGNVSVSGGTMTVSSIRQSSATLSSSGVVQVSPGFTTSELGTLAISDSGKLNLANNSLTVATTPAATVRQYLKTGHNGGNWQGNGLTSSSAAANPGARALGHSTDAGGVTTVMYTVAGDANLSGGADGSDFNIWNANRFQAGVWDQADFNYSDSVDGSDFNIWNANRFQSVETASLAQAASLTVTPAAENVPLFIYDPSDGVLHMDTNQSGTDKLVSFLVTSPEALEILKFKDGTLDEGNGWAQEYFQGREQWIATFGDGVAGAWDIARFDTGLDLSSFGAVEYGVRRADGSGFTGFTEVTLVPEPAALGLIGLVGLGLLGRRRRAA